MNKNKKDVSYYLNLPWTYTIETEPDDQTQEILYIVSVNELPGVRTDATTVQEAMELIKDAMEGAFRLYMKHGDEIPEPIDEEEYKGNIAYRTSSRRHYMVAREAQKKKISLSKALDELVDQALNKN